jgi:hypothetical protein
MFFRSLPAEIGYRLWLAPEGIRTLIRFGLWLGLMGHGLVSLGIGPGHEIHLRFVEALGWFSNPEGFLGIHGIVEICFAQLMLLPLIAAIAVRVFMIYVFGVALVAVNFYHFKVGSYLGLAEFLRRMPWFVMAWYLLKPSEPRFIPFLRIAVSLMFLSHGMASLGFMGLNGMHVEIAGTIFTGDWAARVVEFSGYTDIILGILLLFRINPAVVSKIAFGWISLVVMLSYALAFSDGLFRTAFLLCSGIVAFNKNAYLKWVLK